MDAREKWEQLDESAQQQLLEKFRDVNVYTGWWGDTYEQFKDQMHEHGVRVDRIFFSAFWSQGDGACFEGAVKDWPKFLSAFCAPELAEFAKEQDSLRLRCRNRGYYYHEHCVAFDAELTCFNPYDEDEQPLRYAAWVAMYGEHGPLEAMEADFIEFLREHMRDLYRSLEREYDYLTSDELIRDYILDEHEDEIDSLLSECVH
jgi:hypothetical protein